VAYAFFMYHKGFGETLPIRYDEIKEKEIFDLRTFAPFKRLPYLHTRNNTFEYNELHSGMKKNGDANCLYARGTGVNNLFRLNYIHDMIGTMHGTAFRFDDFERGNEFSENIIHRTTYGAVTVKGMNHLVNNYFVDLLDRADKRNTSKVWLTGYLKLPQGPYKGMRIQKNIFYHTGSHPIRFVDIKPYVPGHFEQEPYSNSISGISFADNLVHFEQDPDHSERFIEDMRKQGISFGISADPSFRDVDQQDFTLAKNSPARRLGIKQIERSLIGLQRPRRRIDFTPYAFPPVPQRTR
jgi:hypothetical protein